MVFGMLTQHDKAVLCKHGTPHRLETGAPDVSSGRLPVTIPA